MPVRSAGGVSRGPVVRREAVDGFEAAKAVKKPAPPVILQRGSTGPGVKALQDWLVKAKLMSAGDVATGPGVYGPRTEQAVRRFQESVGLPQTGVAGPSTMAAVAAQQRAWAAERAAAARAAEQQAAMPTPLPAVPSGSPLDTFTGAESTSSTHRQLAGNPSSTVTDDLDPMTDTTQAVPED